MEDKVFLIIKKSFWRNEEIKNLSGSYLHFLIDLLYLSFEWHHKPFYQTSEQIYSEFGTYRVDFNRKIKELQKLAIHITYKNKKYYFDLSSFFEIYSPLGNKGVTLNTNTESNISVQEIQKANRSVQDE